MTVLLIGAGRLAKHLKFWNSLLDKPNTLLCWDRKQNLNLLKEYLQQSDVAWLAITDSAIVPFFEQQLHNYKKPVIHFSGALHDERLFAVHPLMSFPENLFEPESYGKIHFALTGAMNLELLMPGFSNPFFQIAASQRALYHALCVVAGNFPQLLWNETYRKAADLNIPEAAFQIYLQQITENFLKYKNQSLTGPIIRKDEATIEKNLSALKDSKLELIYRSFVKEFLK